MKKTFVLLLILCSYFSHAQNNKQRFDEAVNYIICVCLNDVAKTQKDCNNEDYYQESDFQDKSNNNVNRGFIYFTNSFLGLLVAKNRVFLRKITLKGYLWVSSLICFICVLTPYQLIYFLVDRLPGIDKITRE